MCCPDKTIKVREKLSEDYISLFCEKYSDGTKKLRLKGNELQIRIGRRLTKDDMPIVGNFLKNHKDIVNLQLAYNNLGNEGLKILCENIFYEDNCIEKINLMHCDIVDEGLRYLSECKYLKLKKCRLNGNKIGSRGCRFIGALIENCKSLLCLDIAETDQTQESIGSILVATEKSSLRYLDLSRIIPNSYYTSYNDSALADDVSILLSINQQFEEIHLQKCEFDGHNLNVLMNALRKNTSNLKFLDIGCNNIGDMGAEILSSWLKTKPNLIALNISANKIKDVGARALSYGLPYSRVRFLDITYNKIGNAGMANLLLSLKKYCQIRYFFMWGNKFDEPILKLIQRMLITEVLNQEYIDVKVYIVDGKLVKAYYSTNHYKQTYYRVMKTGKSETLKIKKKKVESGNEKRALLQIEHVARFPPID